MISRLYWLTGLYFQAVQLLNAGLLDSTATLICPLRLGHCIYCWKEAIAVYVNATILGYRQKKDATSFKNMGPFGPVLVKPGRSGLTLVWIDSALKVNRLGPEWFRLWVGLVQFQ